MPSRPQPSGAERLPDELWGTVFDHVDAPVPELLRLRAVSRQFARCASANGLWRQQPVYRAPNPAPGAILDDFLGRLARATDLERATLRFLWREQPTMAALRPMMAQHTGHLDISMAAVTRKGLALEAVAAPLRDDPVIAGAAVAQTHLAFVYVGPTLLGDRAFFLQVLHGPSLAPFGANHLLRICPHWRDDEAVMGAAVARDGLALRWGSARIKQDPGVVDRAVAQHPAALFEAHASFLDDARRVGEVLACAPALWPRLPTPMRQSPLWMARALDAEGLLLQHMSTAVQSDLTWVTRAVHQDPRAYQYAALALRDEDALAWAAVPRCGAQLRYASRRLRADRALVAAAVAQDGLALGFADAALCGEGALVRAAVAQDGLALQYAACRWRADASVARLAVRNHADAYTYVLGPARHDPDVAQAALQQPKLPPDFFANNPWLGHHAQSVLEALRWGHTQVLSFLSPARRADGALALQAAALAPRHLSYFCAHLRDDREVVLAALGADAHAWQDISARLQRDVSFVVQGVRVAPGVFAQLPRAMRALPEVAQAAVAGRPQLLRQLSWGLQHDDAVVCRAAQALLAPSSPLRGRLSIKTARRLTQAYGSPGPLPAGEAAFLGQHVAPKHQDGAVDDAIEMIRRPHGA